MEKETEHIHAKERKGMNGRHQVTTQQEEANGLPPIFNILAKKIDSKKQSLYVRLDRIFFSKYNQEERQTIKLLLDAWKNFQLEDLMGIDMEEYTEVAKYRFYREVEMLSARVYDKIHSYIKKKRVERKDSEEGKQWQHFNCFLFEKELEYSYNRYFWRRGVIKHSGISYGDFGHKREPQEETFSRQQLLEVNKWIEHCPIIPLKKIHQFMIGVDLISLDERPISNSFMLKLERITKQDQRELFIRSMVCDAFEEALLIDTNRFSSKEQQDDSSKKIEHNLANYFFYTRGSEAKRSVHFLFSKFQNYTFLENRHDYIQWMFPNHYGSSFNSQSFQLSYLEKLLFLDDLQVGLNMLISIYIFLDFMGIRFDTNSLQLSVCSEQRLKAVILVHYHNHLRIMRILACLSAVGFRLIALKLIDLLDRLTSKGNLLDRERKEFETSWGIYGDQSPGVPKKKAKAMCFLEDQSFPHQHQIITLLKRTVNEGRKEPIEEQIENEKQKVEQEDKEKEELKESQKTKKNETKQKQLIQDQPRINEEPQISNQQLEPKEKEIFNQESILEKSDIVEEPNVTEKHSKELEKK